MIKSPENDHFCKMTFTEDRLCTGRTRLASRPLSPIKKEIQNFQSKLTCSQKSNPRHPNLQHCSWYKFHFLLSLFLALSPCQTRINRKTPQLQASLLGLSGLPIPNCQKGSGHKSAQMLLKPVAGIDVNLPPVASSHAFLPCFSTSSMLTSFFNSNPAFSTLIQLFQLQSCFSNPDWLKYRQNSEMILLLTSLFLFHNSIVNH